MLRIIKDERIVVTHLGYKEIFIIHPLHSFDNRSCGGVRFPPDAVAMTRKHFRQVQCVNNTYYIILYYTTFIC